MPHEKLLLEQLRLVLPKLYAQEKISTKEKQVFLKFFFPAGNSTWL